MDKPELKGEGWNPGNAGRMRTWLRDQYGFSTSGAGASRKQLRAWVRARFQEGMGGRYKSHYWDLMARHGTWLSHQEMCLLSGAHLLLFMCQIIPFGE